jgi:hypothetical protein
MATLSRALKQTFDIKAAYRFLRNKKVNNQKLIEPLVQQTIKQCSKENVVLCIQDTTSVNFSGHPATSGLGHIGSAKTRGPAKGLFIHTAIAASSNGTPLGILNQSMWSREHQIFDLAHSLRLLSINFRPSF